LVSLPQNLKSLDEWVVQLYGTMERSNRVRRKLVHQVFDRTYNRLLHTVTLTHLSNGKTDGADYAIHSRLLSSICLDLSIGFSRQKTAYVRNLAESLLDGRLRLDDIHNSDDETARLELLKIKGIGHWTIDIYLLMALGRPDIWPVGDLALAIALQRVKRLQMRPRPVEMEQIAISWRPWRAVAARLLWHYYLSNQFPRTTRTKTTPMITSKA